MWPTGSPVSADPSLAGKTCGHIMDILVTEAGNRGMLIMLDFHRLNGAGNITELWYDAGTSEAQVIALWQKIVTRYVNSWNVFAADLKNEPHGAVTWGDGNQATDWCLAAGRIGNAVLQANPNLLIFVEGIDRYVNPAQGIWDYACWGGNLNAVATNPVTLQDPSKLVYSPHGYGQGIA